MTDRLSFITELASSLGHKQRIADLIQRELNEENFAFFRFAEASLRTLGSLVLIRDGQILEEFGVYAGICITGGMKPGHYELKTSTGRQVWHRELEEASLLLPHKPNEPFQLAASTAHYAEENYQRFSALDGAMEIYVTPGTDGGEIVILFTP